MSSWLTNYLKYTELHEAPEMFHVWNAIVAISASLGRRIWFDRGFYKIYPGQIQVILVGGSATVRKSTSAKIAIELLRKANSVTIISGKTSPEAFIDSLDLGAGLDPATNIIRPRDSHVLIFASELASFLSKQTYTEALIPILTDLADAPDDDPPCAAGDVRAQPQRLDPLPDVVELGLGRVRTANHDHAAPASRGPAPPGGNCGPRTALGGRRQQKSDPRSSRVALVRVPDRTVTSAYAGDPRQGGRKRRSSRRTRRRGRA